jgi:surface protein
VSSVTNMYGMFQDSQFNQDLSSWNVTSVTNCQNFSRNNSVWTLPKPNFTNCSP